MLKHLEKWLMVYIEMIDLYSIYTIVSAKKSNWNVMPISCICGPWLELPGRIFHVTDDKDVDGYQSDWQRGQSEWNNGNSSRSDSGRWFPSQVSNEECEKQRRKLHTILNINVLHIFIKQTGMTKSSLPASMWDTPMWGGFQCFEAQTKCLVRHHLESSSPVLS